MRFSVNKRQKQRIARYYICHECRVDQLDNAEDHIGSSKW